MERSIAVRATAATGPTNGELLRLDRKPELGFRARESRTSWRRMQFRHVCGRKRAGNAPGDEHGGPERVGASACLIRGSTPSPQGSAADRGRGSIEGAW